jgi:hypothetical protein
MCVPYVCICLYVHVHINWVLTETSHLKKRRKCIAHTFIRMYTLSDQEFEFEPYSWMIFHPWVTYLRVRHIYVYMCMYTSHIRICGMYIYVTYIYGMYIRHIYVYIRVCIRHIYTYIRYVYIRHIYVYVRACKAENHVHIHTQGPVRDL